GDELAGEQRDGVAQVGRGAIDMRDVVARRAGRVLVEMKGDLEIGPDEVDRHRSADSRVSAFVNSADARERHAHASTHIGSAAATMVSGHLYEHPREGAPRR